MFTGIVEEMGAVKALEKHSAGVRLSILAQIVMDDLPIGASISVNGACLTVVNAAADREFGVDVSTETLSVTALRTLAAGSPVNLERAMKVQARLGGHLVSGHVDAMGTIRSRRQDGNTLILTIEAPKDVLRYCVPKGSITVDGISLTINVLTDLTFGVAIIPHTAKVTTLGLKQSGDLVNLESDLIGKYVERLLQERGQLPLKSTPVIDKEYLQKRGLI
ncbi:MAG TPA: riboflavin synthase [Nitrospiraceae bacterium]|nr:riboflavin synthase [Nitrospiraceae bacterium]